MPRTSLRKKQAVNYNEDHNTDEMPHARMAKAAVSASKIVEKTNGTISKNVASRVVSAKTVTKRKAEPEPEPGTESVAPAPAAKTAKKRKTKARNEDATPLADRTVVSTLNPTMHIGAHVSAAGGTYTLSAVLRALY